MSSNKKEPKQTGKRSDTQLTYKVTEVADLLDISETTVYRLVQNGDLKRITALRHILIPASELQRFLTVRP